MADLEVDHEVKICITVDQDYNPLLMTIKAVSTEHTIDKIVLWSKEGTVSIADWSPANETAGEITLPPKDGKPGGAKPDPATTKDAKIAKVTKRVTKDAFPVLVDVFEAGAEKDVHRHGWFDIDGNVVASKKHGIDTTKRDAGDLQCWYGLWPGSQKTKKDGTSTPPGEYEKP